MEGRKEGRSHCTVCCSHRRDLGQNAELTQCVPSPRTNKSKTEKREMQVAEVQKSRSAKWAQHKVVHTLHTSSLEEIPLSAGSSQLHTPACSSYNLIIIIIITRPKPAFSRQGLDRIVGPGYSFVVFSTNKTMETNQKP